MPLIEVSTELRAFNFEEFTEMNDERFNGHLEAIPCDTADLIIVIIPTILNDKDLRDAIFLIDNVASMD